MNQKRITFDTNTIGSIVSAYRAKRDGNWATYAKTSAGIVLTAIQDGRVVPLASNVSLELEGVPRKERLAYFSSFGVRNISETATDDFNFTIRIEVGPETPNVVHPTQRARLEDFVGLGGKFISTPRISAPIDPLVEANKFINSEVALGDQQERTFQVLREAEDWGCGKTHLEEIAKSIDPEAPMLAALKHAKDDRLEEIADAIGEWADVDLIAAHCGHRNDILCTNDHAKAAGPTSIFSESHRAFLREKFGVEFMTLDELSAHFRAIA